ncbi:V-type proton ATPase 21 kDa proteolipid subunit [Cucumispora dikerogammari]|nr:V-type proton ATPase 21 kDa proteolipid subunit [Cucumispora dikerogammari]
MVSKLFLMLFPVLLLLVIIFNYKIQTLYVLTKTSFLGNVGLGICMSLAFTGALNGLSNISSAVSGTAILVPELKSKATICMIFCEGSLITAFLTGMTIFKQADCEGPKKVWHTSGVFVYTSIMGVLSYLGCRNVGKIASAVLIAEGKRPGHFVKLLFPILIGGTFSLLGLAFGIKILNEFAAVNSKPGSDTKGT